MMYFLEKISYLPLTPSSQEIVLNDTVSSTILTTDVIDIVYFHLNSQLECINCSQNDTDIVYSTSAKFVLQVRTLCILSATFIWDMPK